MTACEAMLSGMVMAKISSSLSVAKPKVSAARAISVA